MPELLSVDTVMFTIIGYPMSYIEFIGTTLYLASVWLIVRRNMLTWPVGIVSVLLYMALFYQIQLYSDALEQIYYLAASLYGWWYWNSAPRADNNAIAVADSSRRWIVGWLIVTALGSLALGTAMTQVHVWLPTLFPEPASYPYLDALTTVMSLVAMWLLVRKHIESWIYWFIVDVIGIALYFSKGVLFIALLYVVLLSLATRGALLWTRARRIQVDAARAAVAH